MKRKPDDDEFTTVAAVGLRVGRKWVTGHLGGAYGPEISRVKRSLIQTEKDEEMFLSFNTWLMGKAIKAEKKAMAKVPKPPLRKR
jgi:hypothetical protein